MLYTQPIKYKSQTNRDHFSTGFMSREFYVLRQPVKNPSFLDSAVFSFFREVYDVLVKDGTIVPKAEKSPPTVPMDYSWAQVSKK